MFKSDVLSHLSIRLYCKIVLHVHCTVDILKFKMFVAFHCLSPTYTMREQVQYEGCHSKICYILQYIKILCCLKV